MREREPTFTTARVTEGAIVARALHRERLLRDGGDPGLVDDLLRQADARAATLKEGMVRVIVGSSRASSFVEAGPARRRPWREGDPPLALVVREDPRTGAGLSQKTLERSALTALDEEAKAEGADGALLVGPDGSLREGTWFSFLLYVDGAWSAPPVGEGVLFSTTRAFVERALRDRGKPFVTRRLSLDDLSRADAAACLSALLGASAVRQVGDVRLPMEASLLNRLLVCWLPLR